jgi:hypothetical protein
MSCANCHIVKPGGLTVGECVGLLRRQYDEITEMVIRLNLGEV